MDTSTVLTPGFPGDNVAWPSILCDVVRLQQPGPWPAFHSLYRIGETDENMPSGDIGFRANGQHHRR